MSNCSPVVVVNGQPPVQILISGTGPVGPIGPAGPTGPAGPVGPGGGSYFHTQMTPSDTWTIVHNLGYRPAVTATDTQGELISGNLSYSVPLTTVVLTFSVPIAGEAALS